MNAAILSEVAYIPAFISWVPNVGVNYNSLFPRLFEGISYPSLLTIYVLPSDQLHSFHLINPSQVLFQNKLPCCVASNGIGFFRFSLILSISSERYNLPLIQSSEKLCRIAPNSRRQLFSSRKILKHFSLSLSSSFKRSSELVHLILLPLFHLSFYSVELWSSPCLLVLLKPSKQSAGSGSTFFFIRRTLFTPTFETLPV